MYLSTILPEIIVKCVFLFSLWTAVISHRSHAAHPEGVHFTSVNLRNIVQWRHGKDTPNDTHYTVEYAIYGDMVDTGAKEVHWRVKKQCVNIPQTWCDLSNETTDLDEIYYARVKAVGPNLTSRWSFSPKRFYPKFDTTFGPPIVKLVVKENRVTVKLKGPMRWKTGNQTKDYSMFKFFLEMTYTLFVYDNRSNKTQHFTMGKKSFEYGLLTYETEYCFSAKAQFLSFPSHVSERQCQTTPSDPFYGQLLLMAMGIAVPSVICLFILILVGCLVHHFIFGRKQRRPSSLGISTGPKPQQTFCPEQAVTVNVIMVTVVKPDTIPDVNHRPELKPQLSYTAQQVPEREAPQEGPTETDYGEEESKAIEYGFVGAEVPKIRSTEVSDVYETLPLGLGQVNPYVAQKCTQEPLGNIDFTGICLDRDSETGLFRIPLTNLIGARYKEPDAMGPYAAQRLSVRETPERDPWEVRDAQMNPCDCGFVGTAAYLKQSNGRDVQPLLLGQVNTVRFPEESEEDEDEGGNCVDWSPTTGILQIPLLSRTVVEVQGVGERETDTESEAREILPSVIVRQCSESESECDLTKLQNVWDLQITYD
ncbi:hypothetical protein DPEC_G00084230 [Dallia pectoralis]|uniref:Uncharacterized protein n=1 Tax=Dallia pectoralis TaxID=75939 RepID=A0ACC2GZS3_DALPE|nr:hypothetical protein DPEC_G00084230 [Dallia pectoralis]